MRDYALMKRVKTSVGELYIGDKDDALAIIAGEPIELEGHYPAVAMRFDRIWNLAKELAFMADDEANFADAVILGQIEDQGIPDMQSFVGELAEVINVLGLGGSVFVHCLGGVGRTAIALAAIKLGVDEMNADEALQCAKDECNGPETDEQIAFVRQLAELGGM